MTEFDSRPTQTRVKHEILEEYLQKWAGIITQGLGRSYREAVKRNPLAVFNARFVYVDCFAFEGRYASEKDGKSWANGSPLIGIEALDKAKSYVERQIGFKLETYVILFEKEKSTFEKLLVSLNEAGYEDRLYHSGDFPGMSDGQIAVLHGDYRNHIDAVLSFTGRPYTWAFYLLDPYGFVGMEMDIVSQIIRQDRNDVMINFMYYALQKDTGRVPSDLAEDEKRVHHWDRMYGSEEWRAIVERHSSSSDSHSSDNRETQLVQRYAQSLQNQDSDLVVKSIPLLFKDRQRTMFYLFLTTHDPTGALAINEILYSAKQNEYDYRVQWKNEQLQEIGAGIQQSLFGDAPERNSISPPRPSVENIEQTIYKKCAGQKLEFREVMRRVVNTSYFPGDVKSAVARLRKRNLAKYEGQLRNDTIITFV